MTSLAHAGTATSLPGSAIFDEDQAGPPIIPTPKLESRGRTKQYEKDQEPLDDEQVDVDATADLTKRELVQMQALKQISPWLRANNFREMDVNEQQVPSGCFLFKRPESMCPIHVAAKRGHERIINFLLLARADPKQKTSRGRTALEIAQKADKEGAFGSHRETLRILLAAERTVSVRRAIEVMGK
ncbi:unnamed protein product [Symbiodinium microadriaticum]|nr:unnamed protein product [Symbiodinium microadriaticum]